MRTIFNFLIYSAILLITCSPVRAQDSIHGDEIPTITLPEEDDEADRPIGWEEVYRTSDEPGEHSTQYRRGKNAGAEHTEQPSGRRLACECMDGEESIERGKGACSGHGGVRYWVYETADGQIKRYPTLRHEQHPEPLSADEIANLSAHQPREEKNIGNSFIPNSFFGFSSILTVCVLLVYFIRQTLGHDLFTKL